MGSRVGAENLWPCQSLPRWEMRPWRQVRQGHAQPVKHAPLKFPDLAASYESVLSLQLHKADRDISFFWGEGGATYTHSDSWRELDDKIVTASANSWLASTKTENKERTLKRNFSVLGIAVICLTAETQMRRLVPLFVRLVKGSWLA